jgi:DNA-binding Xre family transcriptional regulator
MKSIDIQLTEHGREQIEKKAEFNEHGKLCRTLKVEIGNIVKKYQPKHKSKPQTTSKIRVQISEETEAKLNEICNEMSVSPSQLLRVELYRQRMGLEP